ncbi:putative glutathione S-transferase 8 [Caenorhabditis elegans]|uniref:Probable glutathione S-transferase 8 n=1 Tax=Caenorhabditis elegans TaxID=6239 RepID=GST8_CAEEL|nr:putative glutathione S-transferase 8 [Caenorhabditis elegans]P91254.1 RecName: Full=Probable glutathione S-transferase 8; AltName: Full=GST class-sigma [Caenorhabditis elegans]CCD69254.1 Probable glutathione S-transferase 8 [Caenorhabditis elegans]|eukprot:NP_494884.1 Probable glutathione S-transferase 8 [Caenorhabditis elegans]
MVHYKLSYFPIRGAGEVIRQIFVYAGQSFEDHRISIEEWAAVKPTTPFGQLPLLEVDGKVLPQSHSIARFLARQFGINGKCAWEEAQVNSIADQFKDYRNEVRPYVMVKMGFAEGDLDALSKDVFLPGFKKHYGFIYNFLKTAGSGYLVGDSLTFVDLLIAQHTADILSTDPALLEEFPQFKAHQEKVHSNANIKKWLETRPETQF